GPASANGHGLSEVGFLFSPINEGTVAASNPFWGGILAGVETEALKSRIRLTYRSIGSLRQRPAELVSVVQGMRLGGALVVGPAEAAVIQALQALQIPLVQVEGYIRGAGLDAVVSEGFEGGRQATAYMNEQGHRRIAHITGPLAFGTRPRSDIYEIELRAQGYRAALLDAELPVDEGLIEGSNLTPQGGYEACRRLLARKAAFSAIFCANDSTAIGAIRALREAGLAVPGDISVIGYGDDTDIVEHVTPALTTVRIDKEALGATALKRLIARAADPTGVATLTMLEVELIKRESVQPPLR
ncbi:MAG: LacI family transcriptional regulator, partial [Chloroflexi bacterium]|nr:LacI family transcriptional regulator [Chloroflexota bacterium]